MSATAATLKHTWPVGQFTATLAVSQPDRHGRRSAVIEWAPRQPERLSAAELVQCRQGRDAALLSLGLTALVIEA